MKASDIERFDAKYTAGSVNDCWEWQAATCSKGYGAFYYNGGKFLAHRFSFLRSRGFVPALVRHTCDNRLCVNPYHLIEGTAAENSADMVRRGRSDAWLSPNDVRAVRGFLAAGWHRRAVADWYGVRYRSVYNIDVGKSFSAVT